MRSGAMKVICFKPLFPLSTSCLRCIFNLTEPFVSAWLLPGASSRFNPRIYLFFLKFVFKARREISSKLVRGFLPSYLHARASQWSDIQRGVRRGSWEEGLEQWRGVCSAERLFSGRLQRCETSGAAFAPKPLRINGRKTQMLPRICRQTSFLVAAFLRMLHTYIVNVNTGS